MILLSSTGESFFQLLVVLFCFVVVLLMTYYTTRWIAGYQKQQSITKNLCVVETLKLTPNKYLQLVQAGEERFFLIAIGKDEVTMLGEITKEQLKELPSFEASQIPTVKGDFEELLQRLKEHKSKK